MDILKAVNIEGAQMGKTKVRLQNTPFVKLNTAVIL
jgi:hypothetical protein